MILVTGCAGFIGFHLCKKLLDKGESVIGIDNLNDYYSPKLKQDRLDILQRHGEFRFYGYDIRSSDEISDLFFNHKFDIVYHLAAQAGVRYSIENPRTYLENNIDGFFNILEMCRISQVGRFFYASSSSIYGGDGDILNPGSFYAASKAANELMARSYQNIYKLSCTALRFFTVYGPWGRPDMSIGIFFDRIAKGEHIELFNNGKHRRCFTYVDDVIDTITDFQMHLSAIDLIGPVKVNLTDLILEIEKLVGKKASIRLKGLQKGDVVEACLNKNDYYHPMQTKISEGLPKYWKWAKNYYGL